MAEAESKASIALSERDSMANKVTELEGTFFFTEKKGLKIIGTIFSLKKAEESTGTLKKEIESLTLENTRISDEITVIVRQHRQQVNSLQNRINELEDQLQQQKLQYNEYVIKNSILKQQEGEKIKMGIPTGGAENGDTGDFISVDHYNAVKEENSQLHQRVKNLQHQLQTLRAEMNVRKFIVMFPCFFSCDIFSCNRNPSKNLRKKIKVL